MGDEHDFGDETTLGVFAPHLRYLKFNIFLVNIAMPSKVRSGA
jgi:hypothetical protein